MNHLIAVAVAALFGAALEIQAADLAEAKALYDKKCASCHGLDGKGDTRMGRRLGAKDYTDQKVQAALKDEKMFAAIKDGLEVDGKRKMKPEADLSEAQVKALMAYLKTFAKK